MVCLVCGVGEVWKPAAHLPASITYVCPNCRTVGGVTGREKEYGEYRYEADWIAFARAIRELPEETDRRLYAADYWQDRGFDALADLLRGTRPALKLRNTPRGSTR